MINPDQHRLVIHFSDKPREKQGSGWSELWESNQDDLWDRGKPSPALTDFIESRPEVLRRPENGKRPRALVPGCGKGYDVVMLALHGFDVVNLNVYGLEVSEKGAEIARWYAATELVEPNEYNYGGKEEWPASQHGTVKIIVGDFFKRDWEVAVAEGGAEGFDLIYDYTFLCALLPEMRKDWARRMSELLTQQGVLVCLEFPLWKDLKALGPPWGLRGVYWDILGRGSDGLIDEEGEETETGGEGGAFQKVLKFKPPRSYENGRGTDMVSVWKLR